MKLANLIMKRRPGSTFLEIRCWPYQLDPRSRGSRTVSKSGVESMAGATCLAYLTATDGNGGQ